MKMNRNLSIVSAILLLLIQIFYLHERYGFEKWIIIKNFCADDFFELPVFPCFIMLWVPYVSLIVSFFVIAFMFLRVKTIILPKLYLLLAILMFMTVLVFITTSYVFF